MRLGAALLAAGGFILATSLLVLFSHPGVATGIALMVLGLVILLLGKTAPGVSPELADVMVRVGYGNLGRLFEEVGLHSRAMYLPSSNATGPARALIPVSGRWKPPVDRQMDDRLVVFRGDEADDVGLLVTTPGSVAVDLLPHRCGATMDEIQVALTRLAVATLRIARSVDVHQRVDRIEALFVGETVPSEWMSSAVEYCLGSLSGSIAAALVAEARECMVSIDSESVEGSTRSVMLVLHTE